MRPALPALGLLLALALVSWSLVVVPEAPAPSFVLHASAVNFNQSYTDPTGDVFELWTSNGTHVTTAGGYWVMGRNPGEVNLVRLTSADAGGNVTVALRVRSSIVLDANVTYELRLYPRADNATHFVVVYADGLASLTEALPNAAPVNVTAAASVAPSSTLTVTVNKTLLGGMAAIDAWRIDASAREVAGNSTFEDFLWQVPCSPESAPAFVQGIVSDTANATLAGVTVSTNTGCTATTDARGFYSVPAAPGNVTLTFSRGGYDSASKNVTVAYEQTQTVDAQMAASPFGGATSPEVIAVVVGVVVVAALIVGVLFLRRRTKGVPPPPPPPPQE